MGRPVLNAPQQQAVTHFGGPLLVIAGAGAGKTLVLTQRMLFFIHQMGIPGDRILAITFTNKAAAEMKERTHAQLDHDTPRPFIGTFHSFCHHVLRRSIGSLGRSPHFTIIDTYDQQVRPDLPIGVVTTTARLNPASPLFSTGPGFLITPEDTVVPAGFRVVRAGRGTVDLERALEQIDGDFAQLEGGPGLNSAMFAADLVDEINVTVSAKLVGGKGPSLSASTVGLMHRFRLAHVVTDDGFVFLRYLRAR